MTFWVYILRCADNSYYTGHTDNLDNRMGQHISGAIPTCYTFKRRPVTLAFSQELATREEALTSERQLKGWSRKKKEAMMRGDWAEVSRLAQSIHADPANPAPSATPARSAPSAPSVRPEPVEGRSSNTLESDSASVHPSTGSGRTEGEGS